MSEKVSLEKGLIKEIILVSIAVFFLVQSGFKFEQLFESEFWNNLLSTIITYIRFIFEIIEDLFGSK